MFNPAAIREPAFAYYARLNRVRDYVEHHYSENITLTSVADVAGLEPTYFSHFFHQKAGVPFSGWLTYIRINHAKQMITTYNTSISAVAQAVGYHDLRTFERAFKRCVGSTPMSFKQSVRPS
jgi:xylan 1,4-beta-xylosidase